jgi:hypothetical protein
MALTASVMARSNPPAALKYALNPPLATDSTTTPWTLFLSESISFLHDL